MTENFPAVNTETLQSKFSLTLYNFSVVSNRSSCVFKFSCSVFLRIWKFREICYTFFNRWKHIHTLCEKNQTRRNATGGSKCFRVSQCLCLCTHDERLTKQLWLASHISLSEIQTSRIATDYRSTRWFKYDRD